MVATDQISCAPNQERTQPYRVFFIFSRVLSCLHLGLHAYMRFFMSSLTSYTAT